MDKHRYHSLGSLEKSITLLEGEQTFLFVGQATDLQLDLADDLITGIPTLTKYSLEEKERWYVQLWPPAINTRLSEKRRICWQVKEDHSYFFMNGETYSGYREGLRVHAKHKNLILERLLLTAIFDPIDQKLRELYDQVRNS